MWKKLNQCGDLTSPCLRATQYVMLPHHRLFRRTSVPEFFQRPFVDSGHQGGESHRDAHLMLPFMIHLRDFQKIILHLYRRDASDFTV